ncbi:Uncharacterised protein [Citrobacter koseri]|uniref:Uncharacterized protein n=1 Tax=Citrobacter koseri TaxID=545 RepID=A0A2X2W073_CITKO|nr:Uncharacterised protein [Citrobacter koseri]
MVNRSVRFDATQSDVSEQSAMSEERTYPYKAYHPEMEVPPKGKHSQTF